MPKKYVFSIAWIVCGLFLVERPTWAAGDSPRDELLRLVPEDVGICMIVQDLRETVQSVRASAFVQQFQASALGTALRSSPETKRLRDVELYFKTHFDIGWERLLDDILGDAIVLSYWPGPPGKPDDERGVMLVRARDPKVLADVFKRLPAVTQQSQDVTLAETRKHDGTTYSVWHDGKKTTYSYLNGSVAAITHHENLLHRLITRDRAPTRGESPIVKQLQRLGIDKALAAVWFNPRAFDAELEYQMANAPDIDPGVRAEILSHWRAVEGFALAAKVDEKEVALSFACVVQSEKLPEKSRLFFKPGHVSEMWSCFPDNAMLTVAGRIDAVGVTQLFSSFLDDDRRKEVRNALDRYAKGSIGRDVEKEVFPSLGPDWGFCIVPPPADEKAWYPYLIAALRIQPGTQEPPLDRALASFLNGLAMLAVVFHNSSQPDAMSLHTEMQGTVEVKYFVEEKKLPVGFRPAFAMKDGFLVVASSPAAIRQFTGPQPEDKPAPVGSEIPWLRLSPSAVKKFVRDRSSAIANHIAAQDKIPLDEAGMRLAGLCDILTLLDRIEVTQRSTADQFHITLRIRTAERLRK